MAKSTKIKVPFEATEVEVIRRSSAHEDDVLVNAKGLANRIERTAPRCSELFLQAGVECVGYRGQTKLFWLIESMTRLAVHWSPAKYKKGEKKKNHSQIENEKVGALEQRRIRSLDIKNAKDESEWIPVDVAMFAVSRFQQDARSIFSSCIPLLKQKHADELTPDMYQALNDHMSATFNLTCEIKVDVSGIDIFATDDETV